MNKHIIAYQLNNDDRKEFAKLIRPIKPWVHIKTWLVGALSIFAAYLSYRLIYLLAIAVEYVKEYNFYYEDTLPKLLLTSEELSAFTSNLLTVLSTLLVGYFILRIVFFYAIWLSNERAVKRPAKNIAVQDTVLEVSVDPQNYYFQFNTQFPTQNTPLHVSYIEQDIIRSIPFKDGYILVLSMTPFFKESLTKYRKPLTKNKKIFMAAIRFNLYVHHRILNNTGHVVYFPLTGFYNEQEEDFLRKRLDQYLEKE